MVSQSSKKSPRGTQSRLPHEGFLLLAMNYNNQRALEEREGPPAGG